MISDVGICNLALTKLGEKTITALTENSETARRCNIVYEQVRDSILRLNLWNFSQKIEALSLISNETIINYDYLYILPARCLYISQVFDEDKTTINEYEILLTPTTNIKCIATNTSAAYIKYVKQIIDTSTYDVLFVDALANKLAAELSKSITGSQDLSNTFLQLYNLALGEARKVNAQEKHSKRIRTSQFIEAR